MNKQQIKDLLLKENLQFDNFYKKITENPIKVKKYIIEDNNEIYLDNNNFIYWKINTILKLELGIKIGYLKNKILYLNKKKMI